MDGQQHIYHGESLESTMKMGTATENSNTTRFLPEPCTKRDHTHGVKTFK